METPKGLLTSSLSPQELNLTQIKEAPNAKQSAERHRYREKLQDTGPCYEFFDARHKKQQQHVPSQDSSVGKRS